MDKELKESIDWLKKELFNQNEFLDKLKTNQKQIESLLLLLLKEYKDIRSFERKFKSKS